MVVAQTTSRDQAAPDPINDDQGARYTVDHVLELQLIVAAFAQLRRDASDDAAAIDQADWDKAHNLVNGFNDMADQTKKVAEQASEYSSIPQAICHLSTPPDRFYESVSLTNVQLS